MFPRFSTSRTRSRWSSATAPATSAASSKHNSQQPGMYLKNHALTVTDKSTLIRGEKLEVVVVYADLRNFAEWSLTSPAGHITRVIEVVYDRVIQLAFFYKHTFHKFLGDGFVLIWEVNDHGSFAEALHWALNAA